MLGYSHIQDDKIKLLAALLAKELGREKTFARELFAQGYRSADFWLVTGSSLSPLPEPYVNRIGNLLRDLEIQEKYRG